MADIKFFEIEGIGFELYEGQVVIVCPICDDLFQADKGTEEECPECQALCDIDAYEFLAEY